MPATKYTYSIASDFPDGAVNPSNLDLEIRSSPITKALDRIDTSDDVIDIWFKDALSTGEETILDGDAAAPAGGLIATHDNTPSSDIQASVGSDFDLKAQVVGGQGTGGWIPDPTAAALKVDRHQASVANTDGAGNLQVRGQVLSDEGNFRDDFPGSSLAVALTGTLTFSAGSMIVTGSGTVFTEELSAHCYIKRDADDETAWTLVSRVVSDTELELDEPYLGTAGASATSKTFWPTSTGSGSSFSVGSGLVVVSSGVTGGEKSYIWRTGDYLPMAMDAKVKISQRIANQTSSFGFMDDPDSPKAQAVVIFDGTDNTKVRLRTSSGAAASEVEETLVSIPSGLVTSDPLNYQIGLTNRGVFLVVNEVLLAQHYAHIPGPYDPMLYVASIENTGAPASSTDLSVDVLFVSNHNVLVVSQPIRGEALPVRIRDEIHYKFGTVQTTLTSADQVIVSYEVPAGKTCFIAGFSVSADGGGSGGLVKIGRSPVTTEPASPGALDGNIFRALGLSVSEEKSEDFSANPRQVGVGGNTIVVTVTPSGILSTRWRATIDIVLR